MKESLMKSQEDPLIIPLSWSWTGSISLWAGLSWILASDPPLSELYLEALRTPPSHITPDIQCIFCQNRSFASSLVFIPILPDFYSLPPAIQTLAKALYHPTPSPCSQYSIT